MSQPAAEPRTTTADRPWPVRTVARKVADYIARLGSVWVEGQVTQVSARRAGRTAFFTLRDLTGDVSLPVTCDRRLLDEMDPPLSDGARVVVCGAFRFYVPRGSLSLQVTEIRPVGIGELLARIERLRVQLDAEGLFAVERKRPLPFLPQTVGLITRAGSSAERDVVTNATARWAGAQFVIADAAMQGHYAAAEIVTALRRLDADPGVDVIVIARGGGSVQDLLPFSDEALCRAVAAAGTPVVSAIGHEPDAPLLDHVADVRCSTPTAAGKLIVPDVAEETRRVAELRTRAARALRGWVDTQSRRLADLRTRPVLADPAAMLEPRARDVADQSVRLRRAVGAYLEGQERTLAAARSQLAALGPRATLDRGYAIVQRAGDDRLAIVRSAADVPAGTPLRILLADGTLHAVVTDDSERKDPRDR